MTTSYDFINIDSSNAFVNNLPPFLGALTRLLSDLTTNVSFSDDIHFNELDTSYDVSDFNIFTGKYVTLAQNCLNLLTNSHPKTLNFIKCYLNVVDIYSTTNDINIEMQPYLLFNTASYKKLNISEVGLLYAPDNQILNLFKLSINSVSAVNRDASVLRLYEILSNLNDQNIVDIIISVSGSGSYYSNNFIEYYLTTKTDGLSILLDNLSTQIDKLSLGESLTSFNILQQNLSTLLVTDINDLFSAISTTLSIVSRVNYSENLISKLDELLGKIKILFSILNLVIIKYNINHIQDFNIYLDSINSVIERINQTLIDNQSKSEVDLLIQQANYSYNPDVDLTISKITSSLRNVIYSLTPEMLKNAILLASLLAAISELSNKAAAINFIRDQVLLARNMLADKISWITTQIGILSHVQELAARLPFLKSLSTLTIEVNLLNNHLNTVVCEASNFMCVATKALSMGSTLVDSIIGATQDVGAKTNDAVNKSKANVSGIMSPRLQAPVELTIDTEFVGTRDHNLSLIAAVCSPEASAALTAAYATISATQLKSAVNVEMEVSNYLTTTVNAIKNAFTSSVDRIMSCPSTGVSKGVSVHPRVTRSSTVDMRLPNLVVNEVKC